MLVVRTAGRKGTSASAAPSIHGDAKKRSDRVREVEPVLAFDDHVRGLLSGLRVVVPLLVFDDEHLPIAEPSQQRLNLLLQPIQELLLGGLSWTSPSASAWSSCVTPRA